MSLAEAKKYIQDLHKRQDNPYLWPDYLTGLPEKAAIIRKLEEVYPRLGKYTIAYIRIANIHPYLIKYGPNRHAEIIQWAAAILKTACDECKGCFVGTASTHDFVVMCQTENMTGHMKNVQKMFNKKMLGFYTKEDCEAGTTLSFSRKGEIVRVGLIKLIAVVVNQKPSVEKSLLIRTMGRACEELESGGGDMRLLK